VPPLFVSTRVVPVWVVPDSDSEPDELFGVVDPVSDNAPDELFIVDPVRVSRDGASIHEPLVTVVVVVTT
jgi:alkyl hydroperoxide reductase subunit AhpC